MLLPRLESFNPDLLFISAGFDAHHDDWYHFLTEQDLHWATEQLCAVADRCGSGSASGDNGGRRKCGVISVLEGGYSLSSPLPPATKVKTVKATIVPASVPAVHPSSAVVAPAMTAADLTSPGAEATGAAAVLGRGGRGKAKKGAIGAVASPPASLPVPVEPVVKVEFTAPLAVPSGGLSYKQALQSTAVSDTVSAGAAVAATGSAPSNAAVIGAGASPEETMYAQRPGDGGLVKG